MNFQNQMAVRSLNKELESADYSPEEKLIYIYQKFYQAVINFTSLQQTVFVHSWKGDDVLTMCRAPCLKSFTYQIP